MKLYPFARFLMSLCLGVFCASASASGREGNEIRGNILMQGWVPATCHVSPPIQHHETAASGAERIVLTFGNTCNRGSYKVWLESAVGVQDVNASDGTSLFPMGADRPLIEQSVLSHGEERSLTLDLDRSVVHRVITLRIQPSF